MQTNGLAMDRDKRKMCAKKTRKDGIYLHVVNVACIMEKFTNFMQRNIEILGTCETSEGTNEQTNEYET